MQFDAYLSSLYICEIKKELYSIWCLQTASREIKKASVRLFHLGKIQKKMLNIMTFLQKQNYNYPFKLLKHLLNPLEVLLCFLQVDHRPKCSIVGQHC